MQTGRSPEEGSRSTRGGQAHESKGWGQGQHKVCFTPVSGGLQEKKPGEKQGMARPSVARSRWRTLLLLLPPSPFHQTRASPSTPLLLAEGLEGWYDSFILMQGGGVTLLSFPRFCGWHCILASDKPSVKSVCTKYFNYKNNTALSKSKSKQGS